MATTTPCETVRDVEYLAEDLISKQHLDTLLTSHLRAKWRCAGCGSGWEETITRRKILPSNNSYLYLDDVLHL